MRSPPPAAAGTAQCVGDNELACATGDQCFKPKFKCDGDSDCKDGSDESDLACSGGGGER